LDAVIKIKNHKIHSKVIVLSFLSQLFSSCGPLKKRYTPCLRKNCARCFRSELRQISLNFNKIWWIDDKMAKIILYIKLPTSPHSCHRTTLSNTKVLNFDVTFK